jgi:acyl carrier protein
MNDSPAFELSGEPTREQEVPERIKSFLSRYLGVKPEDVTMQSRIVDDLGADSLDEIEILMELEDMYNIEVSDEDAEKCETVADIVAEVLRRTAP